MLSVKDIKSRLKKMGYERNEINKIVEQMEDLADILLDAFEEIQRKEKDECSNILSCFYD